MPTLALRRLIVIACLTISRLVVAADPPPPSSYDEVRIGEKVAGSIKVGAKTVVLPDGNWQLGVRTERPVNSDGGNNLGVMVRLLLHEIVGTRLSRTLEIYVNKSSSNVNWNDQPCKTKGDSYWLQDMGFGINSQFCARVGFIHGVVDQANGAEFESWARDVRTQGVSYSREMPFVLVTRFSRSDFLRMRIAFDPGVAGIDNSAAPQRHINDWHPDTVKAGSVHEAFYKALVAWAPDFAAGVARDFDRDATLLPSSFGRPALPTK